MAKPPSKPNRVANAIALVVIGIGIGCLSGLSVSPVVSIVLTSLTGAAAAIVAVLGGIRDELLDQKTSTTAFQRLLSRVTPIPLACLVIGLLIGTGIGLRVRAHDLLSPPLSLSPSLLMLEDEVQAWVDVGLADRAEVVRRLLKAATRIVDGWDQIWRLKCSDGQTLA